MFILITENTQSESYLYDGDCHKSAWQISQLAFLYKSIAGHYRPVSYGPLYIYVGAYWDIGPVMRFSDMILQKLAISLTLQWLEHRG